MIKIIHNIATDEIIERALTADEISQQELDAATVAAAAQAEAEAEAARAELLARLGITADEAKLLLGGN